MAPLVILHIVKREHDLPSLELWLRGRTRRGLTASQRVMFGKCNRPCRLERAVAGSGSPIPRGIGSMVFLMMAFRASVLADIDHESDEVI
jgi:hypothetical protein